jgi:3-oxoacyl-[acyl-carrier protein] reductase
MIRGNSAITPNRIPIGRFGKTEEVAAIAVMLATNGYITGQTINANGGWYMTSTSDSTEGASTCTARKSG